MTHATCDVATLKAVNAAPAGSIEPNAALLMLLGLGLPADLVAETSARIAPAEVVDLNVPVAS